jgi:hypothetical protein
MAVTNTDAVLWYNVGIFGEIGYGVPNPSDDVGSLNPNIIDLVSVIGRNLFNIMHHEDVDLRIPPSINTLRRVHRLYIRAGQILAGNAVPSGQNNMETMHVNPGGEVFKVYPVPFFKVRNRFLKRWANWIMMSLAEAMQHTENRKAMEISTLFAGSVGQYFTRVYQNMAIELFGKTRDEAMRDGFLLTEADLTGYNPQAFFTSVEMVDTVPALNYVLTEDRLKVLSEGINVTDLPALQPWPVNLTTFYAAQNAAGGSSVGTFVIGGSGQPGTSAAVMPPAPQP